jgi:hypothetical protein
MRELMLENAEGEWNPSQEGSSMLPGDKELRRPSQPFHHRRAGWKCKDRARLEGEVESRESRVRSQESKRR